MNQPKPILKPAVVILSQAEGEALLVLIDIAIKARGLEVANNACALHQKIDNAFKVAQEVPACEPLKVAEPLTV